MNYFVQRIYIYGIMPSFYTTVLRIKLSEAHRSNDNEERDRILQLLIVLTSDERGRPRFHLKNEGVNKINNYGQ